MALLLLDPLALDDKNDPIGSYKIKLRPADYDVKVTATEGYEVSADGGENYSREIVVKPNPGQRPARIEKTLLVRKTDPSVGPGSIRHTQLSSQEEDVFLPIGVPLAPGESMRSVVIPEGVNPLGLNSPGPVLPGPVLPGPGPGPIKKDDPEYLRPEKSGKYGWLLILLALLVIGVLIYLFVYKSGSKPVIPSTDSTQTGAGRGDTANVDTGRLYPKPGQLPKQGPPRQQDSAAIADSLKRLSDTIGVRKPNNGGVTKPGVQSPVRKPGNRKKHTDDDGPTNDLNHVIPNHVLLNPRPIIKRIHHLLNLHI